MTQKKTLKWATSSKVVHEPWQETAKRINERTDGEIDVEFYCLDIVSEKEVLSAVASGKADIGFTGSGTYGPGVLTHCNVSELPYWPSGKAGCAFTKAVVDKYVRSEMEALGVTPIVFEINS